MCAKATKSVLRLTFPGCGLVRRGEGRLHSITPNTGRQLNRESRPPPHFTGDVDPAVVSANDYMTKSFNPQELLARIHTRLRRWQTQIVEASGGG